MSIDDNETPLADIVHRWKPISEQDPISALQSILMLEWARVDGNSDVAQFPASFVETFRDLSKAAHTHLEIAWQEVHGRHGSFTPKPKESVEGDHWTCEEVRIREMISVLRSRADAGAWMVGMEMSYLRDVPWLLDHLAKQEVEINHLEADERISGWEWLIKHPIFSECFQDGILREHLTAHLDRLVKQTKDIKQLREEHKMTTGGTPIGDPADMCMACMSYWPCSVAIALDFID